MLAYTARENPVSDDQILSVIQSMHRRGGMRQDKPIPENIMQQTGLTLPELQEALLRLRKAKRARWHGFGAPAYGQVIEARRNPGRLRALPNPVLRRTADIYDPREEQLRAQKQAIYESCVLKALGRSRVAFRDARGRRADRDLTQAEAAELVRRCAFQIGSGVQARDARRVPGTQTPTSKAAAESKRRYADVDKLLRNRQDYEETLGLARKSGFYRVVVEPTRDGLGYFVWPMPPGETTPVRMPTHEDAEAVTAMLNQTADPRSTGIWWQPPARAYVAPELAYWLPPPMVFSATFDFEAARPPRRKSA